MAGAPPVGHRARTTRTTPSNHVRTTLPFGAHSSPQFSIASVPRQLCHIDHSAAELPNPHPSDLFAPRSDSMLHCTSPRAASTSPKIARRPVLCCLRFGAEAYARRVTDKHTGINPLKVHRRGLRLLKEPIGPHTHLLTEPDRPSRDPLGLRAPCSRSSFRGSFLVVLPGKEQAVLVECLGFLVSRFLSSTRVIVWVSINTSISLARRTNCCAPCLLKIV